MDERFKAFIKSEKLFDKSDTLLMGISGGIDSMVMLYILLKSGFSVAAAHCNFRLRGEESDKDQLFVEDECKKNNIICYSKVFDTLSYSRERGISLQMAARDLRYSWFNEIVSKENHSFIAIAHNKNDLAETFLINLLRGTGIRGLSGIKPVTGNIVRPLLFAGRDEIIKYAGEHNIPFREDSTNKETKYIRNSIRHNIIPQFEKISDAFVNNIYETAGRLKDVETVYSETLENRFNDLFKRTGSDYKVSINSLLSLTPLATILYEFLRRWNFPRELIPDIIASMESISGKRFYSPTHRLVKDRDYLIITPVPKETISRYYIEEGVSELERPIKLKISVLKNHSSFRIPSNPKIACLDMNMIHFPLILRKWQKGDYFQPLGLTGLKKLSDFFIDNKFSLVEKEKTWLLASGNRLAWIIGHRIDERFKITDRTTEILMLTLLE
ncbi:MAG: tRNA lysidine(34) synthetase TilS [Bacteroidales bacterium]